MEASSRVGNLDFLNSNFADCSGHSNMIPLTRSACRAARAQLQPYSEHYMQNCARKFFPGLWSCTLKRPQIPPQIEVPWGVLVRFHKPTMLHVRLLISGSPYFHAITTHGSFCELGVPFWGPYVRDRIHWVHTTCHIYLYVHINE